MDGLFTEGVGWKSSPNTFWCGSGSYKYIYVFCSYFLPLRFILLISCVFGWIILLPVNKAFLIRIGVVVGVIESVELLGGSLAALLPGRGTSHFCKKLLIGDQVIAHIFTSHY